MRKIQRRKITWSADLAYVVGLIATDGNLSSDLRHINITSKDESIVLQAKNVLERTNKIGMKARGGSLIKKYYVLQFGDVVLYDFLLSIGLTPAKSKTLGAILVPKEYFADFFRGCIDGDGSIGTHTHPESQFPQLRVRLVSASRPFLEWVLKTIHEQLHITGGAIYPNKGAGVWTLAFGKADAIKICNFMYYHTELPKLERKFRTAEQFMGASGGIGYTRQS